uniref:Uncharacterized protein n=1 Tax=Trieres chinensis TaxID=1514140 RepID=A0A7S1ZUX8_TRICV|mmetsp:Transcript_33808/g.69008  ORF Transcript_33808/g.69008 Transcript_33808/m.69008 type:complete len:120 (+) Transcript_33808:101-460(+)|eukprot:CAMPEP_0183308154 /NCGR_PEP_ID=MMETSP0160_2-20130417/20104_1 /TAXON_ID=2839 ORGANISM="Odontella Sinensis, Strain Grunow 1884" /NCGR_SAMPLE_ID=MMETSP0160_2 /ASSEMBLY_ACC=CAM_ASM_000250 /LENGTH=119 /DNA_ID=CAMNT_0025471917 /DNA_START=88 /DNA_END=447 /DNA_ORIENTATION=+
MSYSANDNQNYFVEDGRTTSRVLQNPGGKTSINLAWDEPEPARKSKSKKVEEEEEKKREEEKKTAAASAAPSYAAGCRSSVSSNAYASGSDMNSGNVITNRPSSRVSQPPGGRSQITLG